MNEVLVELSKPIWWISVVFAGIAINLISAYIKSPIDRFWASTSSRRKGKYEMRLRKWEARIALLRDDVESRQLESFTEIRQRMQAIHLLLLSIFMLLLRLFLAGFEQVWSGSLPKAVALGFSSFVMGMSAAMLFGSFLAFKLATETRQAIAESRRPLQNTIGHAQE